SGCTSLTSMDIPDSVTDIGYGAFHRCRSLKCVKLPAHLTGIGQETFRYCSSLVSVKIPGEVTEISSYAFANCESLETADIPQEMTRIGDGAFENCISLTNVVIPEGVIDIGASAFEGCRSIEIVTIPDSVKNIGHSAFMNSCICLKLPKSFTNFLRKEKYGTYVTCYSYSAVKHAEYPIYLAGGLSDLKKRCKKRAVKGFFFAQEHGINEIDRWKDEYLQYIKRNIRKYTRYADKQRSILLFLLREGLMEEDGLTYFLEKNKDSDDDELKAALLQFRQKKSGTETPADPFLSVSG
ncbi:MAG: leucine-rich repeat domain-containing protein, partial [Anaerolineaceae bacterium]|nr:leucine-rich repeat domain-containing protein [Anaerolineaceae bacterium]